MGHHHHHHHKKKKSAGNSQTDTVILDSSIAEKEVKDTVDASQFFDTSMHQIRTQKDYVDVKDDVTNSQTILSGLSNPQIVLEPDMNLLKLWVKFDDGKLKNITDSSLNGNSINVNYTDTANVVRWDYNQTNINIQDFFVFPGKAANLIQYVSSAMAFDTPFYRQAMSGLDVTNNINIQLDSVTGYSVSFWIYFNTVNPAAADQQIVTKEDDINNYWVFYVESGTTKINFHVVEAGAAAVKRQTNTTVTTGTWYHVVGVYNASTNTSELYLNGTAGASSSSSTSSNLWTDLHIGDQPANVTTTGYIVDDLRYYKAKVLSSAEVTQLYNYCTITAGVTYPAIVGLSRISS